MVVAEVAYTRTNTQSRLFGGGIIGPCPKNLQGAIGLPQVARWKAASDKEIASLENHVVFKLVAITSVLRDTNLLAPGESEK